MIQKNELAQTHHHSKKNQMNDNIDMDGTIAGSYKDLDMYKVDLNVEVLLQDLKMGD